MALPGPARNELYNRCHDVLPGLYNHACPLNLCWTALKTHCLGHLKLRFHALLQTDMSS
jgi:hypothetical protein